MSRAKIRPQIQRFRHVTQIYNPVNQTRQVQNTPPDEEESEEDGELKAFDGEVIGILEIED